MDIIKQNNYPLYSSDDLWKGITVSDDHLSSSAQVTNQQVQGHRIAFNIDKPLFVQWKERNSWRHTVYETGALGIVPDGEYNDIKWTNDLHVVVIALKPEFVANVFEKDNICISQHRGVYDQTAYEMALLLKKEIKQGNLAGKVLGQSVAVAFATHLICRYANTKKFVIAPKGKLSAGQLKKVIEYCNDMTGQNLNLRGMADEASLSIYHFTRMFKRSVGISPYQYLLQLKIEKAIQLLKEKKKPVSEIACILGFADQAHFSNAFKKATGYPPHRFGRAD